MATLLYIHGFNSSSSSLKGRLLQQSIQTQTNNIQIVAPDLLFEPAQAIQQLQRIIEHTKAGVDITLIGSSLGGYYATYLAEKYAIKAVLVNPAVKPYDLLSQHLGVQQNIYTGETYTLTHTHIDQLLSLEVEPVTLPARYLLMLQTGDEILDYRQAVEKYAGSPQIVIEGGDHGFQRFSDYIERILSFAQRGHLSQV